MLELLEHYTLTEIAFFIVLLAAAIKGIVTWFDWAKERINKRLEKDTAKTKVREELRNDIDDLKESVKEIKDSVDRINKTINLLMDSDKDDIKAYITREHHYFCYKVGSIDDYNLDCVEKRYAHYKDEGGNSFIADLMGEIRALPKKSGVDFYTEEKVESLKDNNRD